MEKKKGELRKETERKSMRGRRQAEGEAGRMH